MRKFLKSKIRVRRNKASDGGEKIRFTYSTKDQSLMKRAFIQAVEEVGGRAKLRRLYNKYVNAPGEREAFFDAAIRLMRIHVNYNDNMLAQVPLDGPVVFVSNHPYGVLDGITLSWLASKCRPDTKVLANSVLCQAPDARDKLLPIDFSPTDEARQITLQSRLDAQKWLKEGNAIGIFPAGGVSASEKPLKGPAVDLAWHPFTAKLIRGAKATVVPVYFSGQNSRVFQMASHLSHTLRLSLFFRETARRIGTRLDVAIGEPIEYAEMARFNDRNELVKELRRRTFALASDLPRASKYTPDWDREFRFPDRMSA